jgi:26S proteasome regulatory subunit N12
MAEKELHSALQHLHQTLQSRNYQQATTLLSKAKMALLQLNALIPQEKTPKKQLQAARETLELGAIISIRLKDTVSFTRYFQQLQPFYALPAQTLPRDGSQASKVTGLYLLLLLSEGDYAGFHTLLETLEVAAAQEGKGLEDDQFIQYPIRLEQALMEGSYDRVWGETKSERVPSEEFGMFSEVCYATRNSPFENDRAPSITSKPKDC